MVFNFHWRHNFVAFPTKRFPTRYILNVIYLKWLHVTTETNHWHARATQLMSNVQNLKKKAYSRWGKYSPLFILVCSILEWCRSRCIFIDADFGCCPYGHLWYREWSWRIVDLSTSLCKIWKTIKEVPSPLVKVMKAVSVTTCCNGGMSNTWEWYTHYTVITPRL